MGWASRLLVATLVATSVVSGVGAVPWLERADSDGDGTAELGVEWSSLAGEAGAATGSGTAGLSCPAGMVLDGNLCKTPKVETVPVTLTCTQPGYVLVSTVGELGASHSCQKTVPAHCTGGKILHQGQCQTETTEQRDANWSCTEGTLVSTFLDPGYSWSCRITVDPPECPEDAESYLTTPSAGCYVEVSFHQTQDYTWSCTEGTLVRAAGDHGVARSCKVTLASLTCPDGETYRNSRCEQEQTFYRTRGYEWTCSSGTLAATSGEHGVSYSCKVTLSPPRCPVGETWRNNRCETQQTFYRTRGYEWTCSSGTLVTTSGGHGVSYSCKVTLSPPRCPVGETWRNNRCETQQTYYDSRPYDYSCPSGYTLGTSGLTRSCTKTETYRTRVCSYDPIAGQQCWWENRTRTLTAAVRETCPSGFSPNGTGCTADSPSTRWVATGSSPTRHRYDPATKSCISGYSPAGSVCQADSPSTRWVATGSSPTRHRYDPATKSCISGYSDNGSLCESDTASKRWVPTSSSPTRHRYDPATKSCPTGWSDNGSLCESDTASVRWDITSSTPVTSRTAGAVRSCDTGFAWNDTSGKCEKTAYADPTAPLTKLVGDPPQVSCRAGYEPAGTGRCERTTLGEPTAAPAAVGCTVQMGSLSDGAIKLQGAWSSGCTSARLGSTQLPHWAQSFAFAVPAAATLDLDAVSDGDPYLSVTDSTDTLVASDDDSGDDGRDSRIHGLRLAAGSYTIEVATAAPRTTGTFTLTLAVALDEIPVAIAGLAAGTGWGLAAATVTASDGFAVEPTGAACTATTPAAGITPSVTTGSVAGERTLSVTAEAPFSHDVTIRCAAAGRAAAEATATLAGKVAISSVTVAASDSCTGTTDKGYGCTVPKDGALSVTATAQGAHDGLSIAWTAAGGASVASPAQTAVAATPGAGFSRASTATLTCTADGTAAVTVSAGGVSETAVIAVTCDIAVACNDPLGGLAAGDTARSGVIAADADCVSEVRGADQAWRVHYARRHTFALAGDATVTIDVGSAATPKLDTWLILLAGRTAAGTPLAQDDQSGPRNGSRIARHLAAGDYTIEATTLLSRAAGGYDLNVNTRYDKQVAIGGLTDAAKTGSGRVAFARPFTVTPPTAQCAPDPDTATVTKGSGPADRTLTASMSSPASLEVTVTCEAHGYVAASQTVTLTAQLACSTHLGTLAPGITAHRGGLWGGNACRSPQRFSDGGDSISRYAHRHTITLTSPGWVTIDLESAAGNRTPLDTYLILLEGHSGDGTGTVTGRDDDSGTGTNSRLADVFLQPGDYTIEATTDKYLRTGDYDLTIDARLDVGIDGLDGNSRVGTGPAADHFTVTPTGAACTTSTGTVTAGENGRRVLTATLTALGATEATVTCTHTGYRTTTATSTLTALKPVGSLTVTGEGDACEPSDDVVPSGVQALVECVVPIGGQLAMRAVAQGASARLSLSWSAGSGASVVDELPGSLEVAVLGSGVTFTRSSTAALQCSTNSSVDISALVGGTAARTVRVKVVCASPVSIANFEAGVRNGPGPVSSTLDVAPTDASCHARNADGIAGDPSVSDMGGRRTVAVTVTSTGRMQIAVRCTKDGFAPATATQTFTARTTAHCTAPMGTLTHGTQSVVRALTSDSRCTSAQRLVGGNASFRARWHTFMLDAGAWVTLDLEPADSGDAALDTYLMLLDGHGSGGTVLHRHNNLYGDATRLDDVWLPAGQYTIEATSALSNATGSYRLTVRVDQDARISGLPTAIDAHAGFGRKLRFSYQPTTATVTAVTPDASRLRTAVVAVRGTAALEIAPQRAGTVTLPVTVTHAGRTSTHNIAIDTACPPKHVSGSGGTCTPQDTYVPAGCVPAPLHGPRFWGRLEQAGHYRDYAAVTTRNCASLTHAGRAKFYRFTLRHDLPVLLRLNDGRVTLSGLAAGGSPSLSLWRYKTPTSTTGDEYRSLRLISTVGTGPGAFIEIERTINAGTYLIEIAPSQPVTQPVWAFELLTELPTAPKVHADVMNLGNTGLNDAGMKLGSFLDARGSLLYGAHPDADKTRAEDPFYPPSPHYPWLPFTTDRCSIPASNWPIVEQGLSELNLVDHPSFGGLKLRFLPRIGGTEVPFVYGCMRHDFNWRNLHRVLTHYEYDTQRGVWDNRVRREANDRFEQDLQVLCKANLAGAVESSRHFDWMLKSKVALNHCLGLASVFKQAVGSVPLSLIRYDHSK